MAQIMEPRYVIQKQKQDAAHAPECSHVEHFGETNYFQVI
jgi:hypothetical protein